MDQIVPGPVPKKLDARSRSPKFEFRLRSPGCGNANNSVTSCWLVQILAFVSRCVLHRWDRLFLLFASLPSVHEVVYTFPFCCDRFTRMLLLFQKSLKS